MLPDAEHLAETVAMAIKAATAPLVARIAALEQRASIVPKDGKDGEPGPPGPPGQDADQTELKTIRDELAALREFSTKSAELEAPELPDIPGLVQAEVAKAFAAMPAPKDGEPGPPGQSVDPADVQAMVDKAVAEIPKPQDGRSVTVEDVAPLIAEEVTKAVDALPNPKDGVGVSSALVDRDGHLVLTFTDGATKDVGLVVGRDYDPEFMARVITEEVAKIPRPKDGRDGSLESLKVVQLDEFTAEFQFKDGTPVEGGMIRLAGFRDKGVYRPDGIYVKGDGVTFGGSFFIAQKDDPGKPEDGDGWRLAVKRGRDGKNGRDR